MTARMINTFLELLIEPNRVVWREEVGVTTSSRRRLCRASGPNAPRALMLMKAMLGVSGNVSSCRPSRRLRVKIPYTRAYHQCCRPPSSGQSHFWREARRQHQSRRRALGGNRGCETAQKIVAKSPSRRRNNQCLQSTRINRRTAAAHQRILKYKRPRINNNIISLENNRRLIIFVRQFVRRQYQL